MKDKFGLCWQIVPRKIVEYVSTPGGMRAMMQMMKMDIAGLEKGAAE
jgi:predicted 3-demethylubiquinone-9 3-methyltransferase (glyoxalase superfamily)